MVSSFFNFDILSLERVPAEEAEEEKNNFSNILDMTWSCWYPINGKACQNCIMCKARIIPHI